MNTTKIFKVLGFSMWATGVMLTLMNPDFLNFILWFSGLVIYFIFVIGGQKEQARIVQESL